MIFFDKTNASSWGHASGLARVSQRLRDELGGAARGARWPEIGSLPGKSDWILTPELFSEAERAALDYVTELTRDKRVDPVTFARMATHYSEREICEIVWIVASEHVYNITNIGLNIHSDMLCDIVRKK